MYNIQEAEREMLGLQSTMYKKLKGRCWFFLIIFKI